jgi:hypothetical protein
MVSRVAGFVLPWLAFLALILWAWGPRDLAHTLPAYGDGLEIVSGVSWFDEAVRTGQNPLVYPLNYYPEGWQVGSHAGGAIFFVALWPFARLFGVALALNLAVLLTYMLAFGGMQLLARRYLDALPAAVASLGFTFWGLRWHQLMGLRLNVLLASALLPWMVWAVERGLTVLKPDPTHPTRRRAYAWLALAGVFWGASITATMYWAFIGGIAVALWCWLARHDAVAPWRARLGGFCLASAAALVISGPWLALNWWANRIAQPAFYAVGEVNFWGTSLNSLVSPFIFHPWLAGVARWLYRGLPYEQAAANLGIVGALAGMAGAALAWRDRRWRPALVIVPLCLLLALGLTLRWDGASVQWPALRGLDAAIWRVGYALKPAFFGTPQPIPPFTDAVPLPGMIIAALVPVWERGRLLARYALPASLGFYLLAGLALGRLPRLWQRLLLGALLVIEIVPPQLPSLPFPPAGHPAFDWLSQQDLQGQAIVDVIGGNPSTLVLSINGETLFATRYHHQPTVAGASGVVPAHTVFLNEWLASHQHPFWQPDFAPILRAYRVRYIAMQMRGPYEQGLWEEAQVAHDVTPVRCFPAGSAPWDWPICILELKPAPASTINVLLHDGWSGLESWGAWAEGTTSAAQFIATATVPYRLQLGVFPLCLADRKQSTWLEVNGVRVAGHDWQNCDPWGATVDIPAALVRIGANDVIVHSAYAVTPPDAPADPRRLSVGFSHFTIDPANGPRHP